VLINYLSFFYYKIKNAVTLSIGVATYKSGESVQEFNNRTDKLLYGAKRLGKNIVCSNID